MDVDDSSDVNHSIMPSNATLGSELDVADMEVIEGGMSNNNHSWNWKSFFIVATVLQRYIIHHHSIGR
jgi:hypothetical protein